MHYVAAEIYRRGGLAKIVGDVSKGARLSAEGSAHDRAIEIRVKTKTRGTWQPSTDSGHPREPTAETPPYKTWSKVPDIASSA